MALYGLICLTLIISTISFSSSTSKFSGPDVSDQQERFLARVQLVNFINQLNTSWKASLNARFHDQTNERVNHFQACAVKRTHFPDNKRKKRLLGVEQIPHSFDARQFWRQCPSVSEVRDQSNCGSCWAFGATEVISDRICIASNATLAPHISADDLLSCCSSCGFGCNGGEPLAAFEYWVQHGIVTGGNFTSQSGCKPYPFPPCEHHVTTGKYNPCPTGIRPTPRCETKCHINYQKNYEKDKFYGRTSYQLERDEKSIQREIMTHGPVEAGFTVYEDFETYKSGVYHYVKGKDLGGHAVRMIGWGSDDKGKPYWLVMNSWNTDWGENGLFRIQRGSNECGIEDDITAGLPKLNAVPFLYGNQ